MLGWELPPHNSGGLGVACYYLSKALSRAGTEIDFVLPYRANHGIDFMNILAATNLDPLKKFGSSSYDSNNIEELIFSSLDIKNVMSIRDIQKNYVKFVDNYLASHSVDAVHAHDWLTLEAGMMAKEKYGVPLIAHIHATEYDRSGCEGGNPIVHEIELEGLRMADKIFAVSETTKNIIMQRYHIQGDKIEVVYNGFDPGSYPSATDYDKNLFHYVESQKSQGHAIVSTIARLTIQKGLVYLLQAAHRAIEAHAKLTFLIAGDGEQRDELIGLAAEYGIADHVIFTGFIRGQQWRDLLSISDIFVMSSRSEPFGLTALEAAHFDNALIITKQSGVAEILHSVLTYEFWDTHKLADDIVGLANSPTLLASLKENVKAEYTKISWDDVAAKILQYYRNFEHQHGR